MNITLRPERISDYNKISNLIYDSFATSRYMDFTAEGLLTTALRDSENFDPELSIVAEYEGNIIGHILLSPFSFFIKGQKKKGVIVAPLCVATKFQGKRVGTELIEEAHAVAIRKGFIMSLLCGHENYYPKFGYKNRMFTLSSAKIDYKIKSQHDINISERPIMIDDMNWVSEKWHHSHKNDALSIYPGESISQWLNYSPFYKSSIFILDDEIIGYVKYTTTYPIKIKEFLVNEKCGENIVSYILQKQFDKNEGRFIFSTEYNTLLEIFNESDDLTITPKKQSNNAFMLKVLDDKDEDLKKYCGNAKQDEKNLGTISFPAQFYISD